MDFLLGWLLRLHRDVAMLSVAVGTVVLLGLIRKLATNQDILKRCRADTKQLTKLIRQARKNKKAEGSAEAISRFKNTKKMVSINALKQEARPAIISIIPIVLIALWCDSHLKFIPPQDNETVELRAYFPLSAAGELAHLVPQDSLAVEDGYIKEIYNNHLFGERPYGLASWKIRAKTRPQPYPLIIRSGGKTYEHEILIGQPTYTQPAKFNQKDSIHYAIEAKLASYKPFGLIPGLEAIGLRPWIVAYLIVVIPVVFLQRRFGWIY